MTTDTKEKSEVRVNEREVMGSIKEALRKIHPEPVWAIPEAVINSFTAMRFLPPSRRDVFITLKAGPDMKDTYIIDEGTGITNWSYIMRHAGYEPTSEEYIRNLKDPNYMNKMGLGIPCIASLSLEGEAEFRSVFLNPKGQEEGLVATYTVKEGRKEGWIEPEAHPGAQDVWNEYGVSIPIKTGCWIVIKSARQYAIETVKKILSELFSLKLSRGYHIMLKDLSTDKDWIDVRPIPGFHCDREKTMGYIHHPNPKFGDFRVYGDLRPVDKTEGCGIDALVKQMKIGPHQSDYMCHGHVDCDILEYTLNREGLVIDKYNSVYNQFTKIVDDWCIAEKFDKKPTQNIKSQRQEKKWKERLKHLWNKYYLRNTLHQVLSVNRIMSPEGIAMLGQQKQPRPKVIRTIKRCPAGYHWDSKLDECVKNPDPNQGTILPKGTGEEREAKIKRITKKPKPEVPESCVPDLDVVKYASSDKFYVFIDVASSAIVFNTYHRWVRENIDNVSDETIDLLLIIALLNAIPQNQHMGSEQFLKRVTEEL